MNGGRGGGAKKHAHTNQLLWVTRYIHKVWNPPKKLEKMDRHPNGRKMKHTHTHTHTHTLTYKRHVTNID